MEYAKNSLLSEQRHFLAGLTPIYDRISVTPRRVHDHLSPELRLHSNVFLLQILKAPRDFVKSSILINRNTAVFLTASI